MREHPSYGRGDPGDEHPAPDEPAFRIMRNGKLYARRTALGAAHAVINNVQARVGMVDQWQIKDGRKIVFRS